MSSLSCPGCGGTVRVRRERYYRRCGCGSTSQPVYRAGRPRIVRDAPAPEIRGAAEVRRVVAGGECRASGGKITGHASVFGQPSSWLPGGFVEVVEPTAFDDVLADVDALVEARYNHEPSQVLGSTYDGRLRVWKDDAGLAYEVTPRPGFGWLLDEVMTGRVTASSFCFRMAGGADRWGYSADGHLLRELHSVGALLDVSPVDEPAYPDADDLEVRSLPRPVLSPMGELRRRWRPGYADV